MKRSFTALILSLLFLSGIKAQSKLPSISLENGKWKLNRGMELKDGVLTIKGAENAYRKARLYMPVSELPKGKFYINCELKAENIKQGPLTYMLPKIKAYMENEPETRKAARIQSGSLVEWVTYGLGYKLPNDSKAKNLVIELSMERCSGTTQFKDLCLSLKPSKPNQKFPFSVPADPVCKLDIDTSKTKKFNNDLLGLNSHFMGNNKTLSYADPRIQKLLEKIKVPLMRFPGGTVSNWYNYETDMWEITDDTKTSPKMMKRLKEAIAEKRKFGFDEYIELAKKNGFKSTLVLNALHDSPERCVARVLDRKKKGLDFEWVELGNENYCDTQQSKKINNAKSYLEKCKAITEAIKKVSPETVVAVNISEAKDKKWGIPISKETFYDAVVMHPYSNAGSASASFTPVTIQSTFTAYAQLEKRLAEYKEIYGDKPLILTEWGVLGEGKLLRNHMTALGTADMFFHIIEKSENGPVKNACLHVFSDGYMGLYDCDSKDGKVYKRGYGVMYEFLTKAFLNNYVLGGRSVSPMLTDKQHAVMARAAKDKDGNILVFAVNKLPVKSKLELSLNGKPYIGEYKLESFSETNLHKHITYKLDEDPCKKTKGEGDIFLPPYSISIATLENKK
jgi:hypothetical protein